MHTLSKFYLRAINRWKTVVTYPHWSRSGQNCSKNIFSPKSTYNGPNNYKNIFLWNSWCYSKFHATSWIKKKSVIKRLSLIACLDVASSLKLELIWIGWVILVIPVYQKSYLRSLILKCFPKGVKTCIVCFSYRIEI